MRKVIICVLMVMFCGVARADVVMGDELKKIPALKQGVAYSIVDSQLNYLATTDIVKAGNFAIEVGYAGIAKETGDKLVAVASYGIFNAKKAGVTFPVADLIDARVGIYGGFGRVNLGAGESIKNDNEWDAGISLTAIQVKF